MQKKAPITALAIATTFIGTLIGAGFASGQELLQFFVVFGYKGLWGAALSGIMFTILGYTVMSQARKQKTQHYDDLVVSGESSPLRHVVNGIMVIFLLGILTVMIAGAGALSEEHFRMPSPVGSIVMTLITVVTVMMGLRGLVRSFNIVVPAMVMIAFIIGVISVGRVPMHAIRPFYRSYNALTGHWLTAALIFVSYNTLAAIAVLTPLGSLARSRMHILIGAAIGGLGLGLLAMLLCRAMVEHFFSIYDAEMPLMVMAVRAGPLLGTLYSGVLLAGIYTTAVGCLFALATRLDGVLGTRRHWVVILLSATALIGSRVGFARLIAVLYPLSGYAGALICISIVYNAAKYAFLNRKR